jgi:hypothetical protein
MGVASSTAATHLLVLLPLGSYSVVPAISPTSTVLNSLNSRFVPAAPSLVRLQVHTARRITRRVLREVVFLTSHGRRFDGSEASTALEEDEEGSNADENDNDDESDTSFGARGELRRG